MSTVTDFIAGAIGGSAGVIIGHPFDTVKVQLQTQEYGGRYKNLMDCLKTVQSQSLSKGYFRGMSWPLITYGGLASVFFGSYGFALKKLHSTEDPNKPPSYFVIGAASAFGVLPGLLVSCPTEVVKVTLQSQIPRSLVDGKTQRRHFKGPSEAVVTILKTAGWKGMYRGFWAQLAIDIPAHIMYMCSYVFFQNHGKDLFPSLPSQFVNFVGGGLSGILCSAVILPLDVIKSKIQADAARELYKGFFDCARKVYISEGFRVFFLGFVPVSIQAFPVNAVTLMLYSECLKIFGKWEDN